MCKKLIYLTFLFAFCTTAMAYDIAFYVGQWNTDGWYDASQFDDVQTIITRTGYMFKDIQQFDDSELAAFGTWVDNNTNDGEMDIIWLNGCTPSVLYQFPNVQPDGSRAENWLDGGNLIINVGDWFAYCSYEGGSRQLPDNGPAGAANILDLSASIISGGGQGVMVVTPTGKAYLPSLNQVTSDRPVLLSAVVDPWAVLAVFAQNAAGTYADPVVIGNIQTGGLVAFINQASTGNWINDRGLTCAEFIGNWVSTVIDGKWPARYPTPADGSSTGEIFPRLEWMPGRGAVQHEGFFSENFADVNDRNPAASLGKTTFLYYDVGPLNRDTTYYWCIDELDGGGKLLKRGDVWSFYVMPLKASNPVPADGAINLGRATSSLNLTWHSDVAAIFHHLYLGTDANALSEKGVLDVNSYTIAAGAYNPSTTYYWRVDEEDEYANVYTGDVWRFTTVGYKAFIIAPPDGSMFIDPNLKAPPAGPGLKWGYGWTGYTHEVYLGTDKTAVESANTSSPLYKGRKYPGYNPAPPVLLMDTVYYWRVDEVDASNVKYPGDIWSFRTLPAVGPGKAVMKIWENITPTGTDLNYLYNWPAYPETPSQTSLLSLFTTANDLGINQYGGRIEGWLLIPAPGDYTFWVSSDDNSDLWLSASDHPADVELIAQVPPYWGWTSYQSFDEVPEQKSAPITLQPGKYYIAGMWKEGGGGDHCSAAWQGPGIATRTVIPGSSLWPVEEQFWARSPDPLGTTDTTLSPTLTWVVGRHAVWHDVYYGTNYTDVLNATSSIHPNVQYNRIATNSLAVGPLTQNTAYYWRVDEVNDAHTDKLWKGAIWPFKTIGATNGLLGSYYHWDIVQGAPPRFPFQTFVLSRLDPRVDFDWGGGSPDPLIAADRFSVIWTGKLEVPKSGSYTFWTQTDDGVRLYLDNQLVINQWIEQAPAWWSGSIDLTAGMHKIEMQYYENGGGAVARLAWKGPRMPRHNLAMWLWVLEATNPNPSDGGASAGVRPALTWKPGAKAANQDIYFGTSFNDVNNATTSTVGIYRGNQVRDANSYTVPMDLQVGKVYYWRIDSRPDYAKGKVWSFMAGGGTGKILRQWWEGIQGTDLDLLKNDVNYPGKPTRSDFVTQLASPQTSPDLNYYGGRIHGYLHPPLTGKYTFWVAGDDETELWLSTNDRPVNAQLIANTLYATGYMQWNAYASQQSAQITLQAGKKYYIMVLWKEHGGLDHSAAAWQLPGETGPKLILGGFLSPYEELWAWDERPRNGAIGVSYSATLSWRAGIKAVQHDVYFGTDFDDVSNATTATVGIYKGRQSLVNTSYNPGLMALDTIYYWRVDEVNGASLWRGDVWNFTTVDYLPLEDYNRYTNNPPLIIWQTWLATGGGKVGYDDPNYSETYIVHDGNSMPFAYNNLSPPNFSEASRAFNPPEDFTKYGVKALSLWTRGYPLPVGSLVQAPVGTYTMTAGGENIGDVPNIRQPSKFHDEFHYAYYTPPLSGNRLFTVKVNSVGNTDPLAKAGVMMRASLDASSQHVMMCMTPGNGALFQYRLAAGGPSVTKIDANVATPYYVGVERQGTTFYGVYSTDPNGGWNTLGSIDFGLNPMPDELYVGLCLTAHNAGHNVAQTCTAVFRTVALDAAPAPTITVHQDIGIKSNIVAPLYVTLQDKDNKTATVINPDANAVLSPVWTEWPIPLSSFADVNKAVITKLTVGVGTHSVSTGTIYVDDIRLRSPWCRPDILRMPADYDGDCIVDYYDLEILADNWLVKPPTSISSGLKGYWKFENNLQDSSGNGRHGSDPCGVITYAAGKSGQAASLNGGYVYVGPVGVSGAAARSVAGWAKASTMNMVTSAWINVFGFTCRSGTLGYRSFDIEKWGLGNDYAIHVYLWERAIMPVDLDWHHLAASYDGTTIRWYGDGLLVGEDSTLVLDTNDVVQMGERGDPPNTINFQGLIDEVRIYGRVLSQSEVEYLAGKPVVDINKDGSIDFKDYSLLADTWLEELLWPQQ